MSQNNAIKLADLIGIYGACLSTISAIYYIFKNKYKKPRITIVSYNEDSIAFYIYNKMDQPLTIIDMYTETKNNDKYIIRKIEKIENIQNKIISFKNGTMIAIQNQITIPPKSHRFLNIQLQSLDEQIENQDFRKAKIYERKNTYFNILTVDGKRYKV